MSSHNSSAVRKRKLNPCDQFANNCLTWEILGEMQLQVYDIFKSQDPELFDVIFEIEGKKIYADKLMSSTISPTLKSMISDRWTSKNEPIKIKDYKFNDFQQFLVYIYSGECSLTDENILTMLDIAEFFQVNSLTLFCDAFLAGEEYNFENVFQLLEISVKYSNMARIKSRLHDFISENFTNFLKCDGFLGATKFAVEGFLILQPFLKREEVFQAVYEWAEHQIFIKQEVSSAENLNKNDAIKAELSEFLKYFDFKKMDLNFFVEYIVKRGFLFSYDELSDIWKCVHSNVKVKVTNSKGTSMCGILPGDSDAIEIIKSLKGLQAEILPGNKCRWLSFFWKTECKIPSTPSQIKRRDFISWFLIYFSDGKIGVTNKFKISEDDYLIAEMAVIGDAPFYAEDSCKIEIV